MPPESPADKFSNERASRLGGDLADWGANETSQTAMGKAAPEATINKAVSGPDGVVHVADERGLGRFFINGVPTTPAIARRAGYLVDSPGGE